MSAKHTPEETPKPKTYRARGFMTKDHQQIISILKELSTSSEHMVPEFEIRSVAPSAGERNEYTAVFGFVDKTPRPQYERSYRYPVGETYTPAQDSKPAFISIDSHFKGLTILNDPVDDQMIDLIVLPGLGGGHAYGSFQDSKTNYMWLIDSLRFDYKVFRIVIYGFDTTVPNSNNTQDLEAIATQFRTSLQSIRAQSTTPIVFLAHSLGGLVVKQAIINMAKSSNPIDKANLLATYGLLFFGVPNDGMNINGLKPMVREQPNEEFIMSLAKNSHLLRNLGRDFSNNFPFVDSQIISFYETRYSRTSVQDRETGTWSMMGEEVLLVDQTSATHGRPLEYEAHDIHGLELDHRNLVRFSPGDHNYQVVRTYLDRCSQKAHNVIRDRLEQIRLGELKSKQIAQQMDAPNKENFEVIFDPTGIPQTNHFTGRELELALMRDQLKPGKNVDRRKISVVHGLGGIGKTQLAIEYMVLHQASYTSSFWLDGKTELSLIQSLLQLASQLPKDQIVNAHAQDIKGLEDSRKRAKEVLQWFALKGNTQWLLIYDNIDKTSYGDTSTSDPETSSIYNIREYFPRNMAGSIIITTRLSRLRSLGHEVSLGKLKIIDSLLLLEKHSGQSLKQTSDDINSTTSDEIGEIQDWHTDAISLVNRLDQLPLALVFAGSYLRDVSLGTYLELYDRSWRELHESMENRDDYGERTIITTWTISFHEVVRRNAKAAKLLQLWSYLDNQDLWYQLLHWGTNEKHAPNWLREITATKIKFIQTTKLLMEYSLIERNKNTDSFSMHTVVHDWIREIVNENDNKGLLQIGTITIGLAVPDEETIDSPTTQRRLLPHVDRLLLYWSQISEIQDIVDEEVHLVSITKIGDLCRAQSKLVEAEQMYQRALQGYEKALGPEHTSTLLTVNNLGNLYSDRGKLIEAEQMYQRALQGREKAFGLEHKSIFDTVNNLGLLYYNQGKLIEAEQMYQRALQGYEKALGPEHISTLRTVNNLGLLYYKQGKLIEAEQMYQRALQGKEKAFGPEHTLIFNTVNNLGSLYKDQGKLIKAEQMYQRALQGYEKALGPEHTSTLLTVNNLGLLYSDQGKLIEAEQMYQRALQGKEKALGPKHISTLTTVKNLGLLYKDQGKLIEAEQMYQRALQGYEKALGPEHTLTLRAVNNLGLLYKDQGKLIEAEQMYQRALQGKEKALGPKHASTLSTINNLGLLYSDQGKLIEAEKMYQRALQGYKEALGMQHTSTLQTINNLGTLYKLQGRLAEAKQMYQIALQGKEKALGLEHISTLETVNNLGFLYKDQGKLVEAEQMYQQALQGYEKALGADNCTTYIPALNSVWGLGSLFECQADSEKARIMYSKALVGYEKVFGPHHSKCKELRENIISLASSNQKK